MTDAPKTDKIYAQLAATRRKLSLTITRACLELLELGHDDLENLPDAYFKNHELLQQAGQLACNALREAHSIWSQVQEAPPAKN